MDTFTTSAATSDDSTKLLLSLAKAGENQPSTNKRTMTDDPAELDRIQEQLRFEKEQQRRVAKKTPQPETEPTVRRLTKYPVGTKLRKKFPGYGTFNGTIISSDHVYYQIKYEDSDTEEMAEDEIAQYLVRRPSSRPAKKAKKTVTTWQRTDLLWTSQNLDPHTLHFTVGDLDAATTHRLADFFLFVYERQMIWVRRARGDPAPWTQVPRLQTSNFCNVYRELDRGTTLLHAHLVKLWWYHHNDRPHTARDWTFTVLWTAYSYRLVNRVGTFQKTGFPNLHTVRPFLQSCQKLWQQGEKVFTAAHQTNGWERYSRWMKTMAAQNGQPIAKVVDTLLQVTTVQACLEALEELPGVSRFMSWQLWCDLRESRCLLGVTKDVDTYCLLGPGAQSKLRRLLLLVMVVVDTSRCFQPAHYGFFLLQFRGPQLDFWKGILE